MKCCGLSWDFMRGYSRSSNSSQPLLTDFSSKYSAELTSYSSACLEDPNLRSFDSSLHQRTNSFIRSLGARDETPSSSLDSLMNVYGCLFDLNQNAVNVITQSKEDVRKNKDLSSLVDIYFKSTSQTLDLCNAVEKCVKKTEEGQLIIRFAMEQFQTEPVDTDHLGENSKNKKKYPKTLEELNKFKAIGDPFVGDFVTQYKSVYEQQILLLEELRKHKLKLAKKERNAKAWRTLSNVVFATAFVSVFVLSVFVAAISLPPVVTVLANVLTAPIELAGKWFSNMWKEYEKAVKRQKGLVLHMENGAITSNIVTENLQKEVDNLRISISSSLFKAESALEREEDGEAIGLAMHKVMNEVDAFTEKIKEVGTKAAEYRKLIFQGRDDVLRHILGRPTDSVS